MVVQSAWNRVQRRLHRARRHRSVRSSLQIAYQAFAQRHPRWAQSLFDLQLLEWVIARQLEQPPDTASKLTAAELADAWAAQLGGDRSDRARLSAGALCVAQEFLELLEANGGQQLVASPHSSDTPCPPGIAATPRAA